MLAYRGYITCTATRVDTCGVRHTVTVGLLATQLGRVRRAQSVPIGDGQGVTLDLGADASQDQARDVADITRIYRHQPAACTYEVLSGPGKLLRWSVPASRGHDDLLISTALTVRLDAIDRRDRMARGTTGGARA